MDTRWLGKPGDFSGAQDAWRERSAVFRGCAGAAVPRLQKLMVDAAKGTPIPNATILEEYDRASAQLYWMMLAICKGAALNIAFLAGHSEGVEAQRQPTEKHEPKMRTRFAGQLTSILSFSLQGDTTERVTAWEREIATYERDSGKVLDDEIKIGTFLLRLPESQLTTHLLMRVDTLKMDKFQGQVVAISRVISTVQTQPTPMDTGVMSKGLPSKGGRGAKGGGKRNNQTQQACSRCGNTAHTSANCSHSGKTCRNAEKSVIWRVRLDLLEHRSPRRREAVRRARGARVQAQPKRVGTVARLGTCRPSVPRRRSMQWKT